MLFLIFALMFCCSTNASNGSDPTKYSCENSTLYLNCSPYLVINIDGAFYGRSQDNICPTSGYDAGNCTSENATVVVADICDEKQNCNIEVTNSLFGNPCPGVSKYLTVNYTCVNATGSITIADQCGPNEHSASDVCFCDDRCPTQGFACPALCVSKGCTCNTGYQRDPFTNRCVLKEYCPAGSNLNSTHEVFSDCANCQLTCKHFVLNETSCAPNTKCEPGYVCVDKFARNFISGLCVQTGECPRPFGRWA